MNETAAKYREILTRVLASARGQDYAGYGKFDALNSPLLDRLSLGNPWLRILFTQAVKECPVNLRPLFGVVKSRNPKGIALFARAWISRFTDTGDEDALREATNLLGWLLDNPSPGMSNLCWGYNFLWQSTLFLQDRYEPNVVVTVFCGEAMMHAYRVTGDRRWLDAAVSVGRFIVEDVPVVHDEGDEAAIAYVLRPVKAAVLNNNVLAGALLVKIARETGERRFGDFARRLYAFTVNRRTKYDAWYYTWPRKYSPIRHDNYHTGGILDALLDFREETGDDRYDGIYRRGLDYYRANLFGPDGAPRWMNDRRYPHDIHGAAQGIISYSKASASEPNNIETALRIADWTQTRLYRPSTGDYAYRLGRFVTWDYTLMRWCNGWMAHALGELNTALKNNQ